MTWNFRIMRRYQNESPEMFWYEIVEVYYGEDGIPMMWSDAHTPIVSDLDIEMDATPNVDPETFIKECLLQEFTQMMRDCDTKGPILDERDFEKGGVYSDHPDTVKLQQSIGEVNNMTAEQLKQLRQDLDKGEEDNDF
jgi:hypothetical protein|tara:strand:+ start:2036 stop:2449 length:414 start_codon:yes stop_codon:yes gene_type:complete